MADEKQTKEPAKEPAKPKAEESRAPAAPNLGGIEPITASPVTPKKGKKRVKKNVATGIVHIASTFNNTMITITDVTGNVHRVVVAPARAASRARASRRRSPRRSPPATPPRRRWSTACKTVSVLVKGPGAGRESALRALSAAGLKITLIRDVTPIPHNGCRPPKRRRV